MTGFCLFMFASPIATTAAVRSAPFSSCSRRWAVINSVLFRLHEQALSNTRTVFHSTPYACLWANSHHIHEQQRCKFRRGPTRSILSMSFFSQRPALRHAACAFALEKLHGCLDEADYRTTALTHRSFASAVAMSGNNVINFQRSTRDRTQLRTP